MNQTNMSDLQFTVISLIASDCVSGDELRSKLNAYRSMRLSAFYRLMSRLEEAGFVTGTYRNSTKDGISIRERHYSVTKKGISVANAKLSTITKLGVRLEGGNA